MLRKPARPPSDHGLCMWRPTPRLPWLGAPSLIHIYSSCHHWQYYRNFRTFPMRSVFILYFSSSITLWGLDYSCFGFGLLWTNWVVLLWKEYCLFCFLWLLTSELSLQAGCFSLTPVLPSLSFMSAGDSPRAEEWQRWVTGLFAKHVLGIPKHILPFPSICKWLDEM